MPSAGARNDRPVDSATQTCPNKHYFAVAMSFVPPPEPKRPEWWPEEEFSGYRGEKLKVKAAGIPQEQELDGSGELRVNGVPAGSAEVHFADFAKSIREALAEGIKHAG